MVEFETLKSKEIKFGRNNFIEISKRKVMTPVGEKIFFAISRGFYMPDGSKRWKSSVTLPDEKERRNEIADLIKSF